MQLADIQIIDDPYTSYILDDAASLDASPILAAASLSPTARFDLARIGDGVVESILNFPADIDGHRFIARARYRETLTFERDLAIWRLGRAPVSIVSATLDGAAIDPGDLVVHGATGVIRPTSGWWPAGAGLSVDYDAGWLTPAQLAQGAPAASGPALPAPIASAALRAAVMAFSSVVRDPLVRSIEEETDDMGRIGETYARPPMEGGQDAALFGLLAPWRRLAIL